MTVSFGFPVGSKRPLLLGMVHVRALPGTPFASLPLAEIERLACVEAEEFMACGFDGVVLENMHDRPYLKGSVGREITAGMARVALAVRRVVPPPTPIGIQILAAANREALAVAMTADLQFIRVEGFAFAHVADEGYIEACAADLLRERKRLGAEHISIWTDIQKKHSSHAVTADLSIEEWAHGAEFLGAEGLIITGSHTGAAADPEQLIRVKSACALPVIIGSGISAANLDQFRTADALIVGSDVKRGGHWDQPLDPDRIKALVAARG